MQVHARIYIHKIRKIYFLKNEIKNILLKSIIQDKSIKPKVRSYCLYKLLKLKKKSRISFQKNVCLVLSKHRGEYSKFGFKRHTLKKLNNTSEIANLKNLGW